LYDFGLTKRMSAERTKAILGWQPEGASIFEELERGSYVPVIRAEGTSRT
jgi:hypothetical protein